MKTMECTPVENDGVKEGKGIWGKYPCPKCGVLLTRIRSAMGARRNRVCRQCGAFTTYEISAERYHILMATLLHFEQINLAEWLGKNYGNK